MSDVYIERLQECLDERERDGAKIGRPRVAETCSGLDPAAWVIIPRAWGTILGFLTSRGINILTKTDPKYCPLCENGVTLAKRLDDLRKRHMGMSGDFDRLVLETEIRQLHVEKQLARYERHKVSLENQRARIQERVELTKRDPTRAVMYADFVSWFARNGDKIKDLVFVLIRGGRHLRIHNIHWGAGAGCDSYFVVDAVVHILRNTTFLDNILSLDMVSDNGPCFASRRLWYFMSKAFGLSIQWRPHRPGGLRVENLFLTEYHGQSVADGTGMCAAGFYNRVSLENQSTGYPVMAQSCVRG